MAKAAVASMEENSLAGRLKSWPQRIKAFYNDTRNEMKKVTTPSMKEVQSTTTVVIIAVFLFGIYFFVVDGVIGHGLDWVFRTLAHR
ncbi:MAG: preprotein translocase subunit SecE [Terriglobia bacterium]|jgi:preprotein translocase subunit SecE|nr:preprotein translocase subunit SecE [Terriglobia bacterium]